MLPGRGYLPDGLGWRSFVLSGVGEWSEAGRDREPGASSRTDTETTTDSIPIVHAVMDASISR
jgi:hypothetical protein